MSSDGINGDPYRQTPQRRPIALTASLRVLSSLPSPSPNLGRPNPMTDQAAMRVWRTDRGVCLNHIG